MKKQLNILLNIIIISFFSYSGYSQNTGELKEELWESNLNADFIWMQDPNIPLKINFIDKSVGSIVSWDWAFGDNSVASGQYATHTYAAPGYYYVCLTVEDSNSFIDIFCDSVYVSYTMICSATLNYQAQGLTVLFDGGGSPTPFEYIWNFGDGTIDTAQSIVHTFQTGGNFSVCLNTKSIDSLTQDTCTNQKCKSITVSGEAATLLGYVFVDTNYADEASIYLINIDSLNFFTIVDTALLVDSGSYTYFYFQNIPFGRYGLKAQLLPSSNYYSNYTPTYYDSKLNWSQTEIINITSTTNVAFIDLIEISDVNGVGSIDGKVIEGTAKVPGDSVSNVEILLLNTNYLPVAVTYSDVNGKYNFGNLPFDNYVVYAEVLNKTTFPPSVLLSASNPSIQDVNLYINSTTVTTDLKGINSNVSGNSISQIFPNPSANEISIEIKSSLQEDVDICIYNTTGLKLYEQTKHYSFGKTIYSIDISSYQQGIYFVHIKQGNSIVVKKFVKLL
ncbi:MAG: PKD domain-containing protein [Saprospiraceae bacterium]|nr:PKD domain-containing protein [Saprospiraceae bacterium]